LDASRCHPLEEMVSMTRFYFHVRSGGELIVDREGIELPDLDAARKEADRAARHLVADQIVHAEKVDDRRFEVWDENSVPHFMLSFRSIIEKG
jgi:hypothetical protein